MENVNWSRLQLVKVAIFIRGCESGMKRLEKPRFDGEVGGGGFNVFLICSILFGEVASNSTCTYFSSWVF